MKIADWVLVALAAVLGWYVLSGFTSMAARSNMEDIRDQVADDAVAQYRIAERNGTAMDKCVHAGLVSAAYIQAHDEENYRLWKAVEKKDCEAAGVQQ